MAEKVYPLVEVMISETETITRPMTEKEKADWDFMEGPQWTAEQIAQIRARRGE